MSADEAALSSADRLWQELRGEAVLLKKSEPMLNGYLHDAVLHCSSFAQAVAHELSNKLATPSVGAAGIFQICMQAFEDDPEILEAVAADIYAVKARDPATDSLLTPFLYLKGPRVLEAWRVSHFLWQQKRYALAQYFQSIISNTFGVDIHPAATIGRGIMLDHATGIVIGETAVVGDMVSMLHGVTLGGTGKDHGDRHPKVGRGVMLGAGAKVLGNIHIGDGAKVGAGSVVLSDVAPHTTVAGIPARPVGRPKDEMPSLDMDQTLDTTAPVCTAACAVIKSKII